MLAELLPTAEETSERFDRERFEATVTGDGIRLVQLADEARELAVQSRQIGYLYEAFAEGLDRRELPLCRAAVHALRSMAELEFRFASSREGGVQGVG